MRKASAAWGRAYEAHHRGLRPEAHELLGAGWLAEDGKGGNVVEQPVAVQSLAQRALGDVFEQLERVASTGRAKCRTSALYATSPVPANDQLKRHEAVELIKLAENALDYARIHLDYLARLPELDEGRLPKGARVRVPADDEATTYEPAEVVQDDGRNVLAMPLSIAGGPGAVPVWYDRREVHRDPPAEAVQ